MTNHDIYLKDDDVLDAVLQRIRSGYTTDADARWLREHVVTLRARIHHLEGVVYGLQVVKEGDDD